MSMFGFLSDLVRSRLPDVLRADFHVCTVEMVTKGAPGERGPPDKIVMRVYGAQTTQLDRDGEPAFKGIKKADLHTVLITVAEYRAAIEAEKKKEKAA